MCLSRRKSILIDDMEIGVSKKGTPPYLSLSFLFKDDARRFVKKNAIDDFRNKSFKCR